MKAPNIFTFATSELSQDAFFAWLCKWADATYHSINPDLNYVAQRFIMRLINKGNDYKINHVEAGRQFNHIDVWIKVNDEYFIAIEDKINAKEHGNQLEDYKKNLLQNRDIANLNLIFVYLKTGNESIKQLEEIEKKGYEVINREQILDILNEKSVKNDIYNDYKEHLNLIQSQTNSFIKFENIIGSYRACEGFYLKLQEKLLEWSDWRYVPNPTGGFLGFWYHSRNISNGTLLYIQIENRFEKGIKLVIKTWSDNPSISNMYKVLNEIAPIAKENGLLISKPDKYRAGATSTLAIVNNAFPDNLEVDFDFDRFLNTLNQLEKTIDQYVVSIKNLIPQT